MKDQKSLRDAEGNRIMGGARLSEFSRQKVYEADWTEQTLDLLETWVSACKKSSAAHANAARAARTKYRMISIRRSSLAQPRLLYPSLLPETLCAIPKIPKKTIA